MRNWSLFVGAVMIVVGLIGVGLVWIGAGSTWFADEGPAGVSPGGAVGREIFLFGTAGGRAVPRSGGLGMMGGFRGGCAECHGDDGAGRRLNMMMMGSIETPDIRWRTLTGEMEHGDEPGSEPDEHDEGHLPYDRDSFARAVRNGIDPGGGRLEPPMPRWRLDDSQVDALIDYLRGL